MQIKKDEIKPLIALGLMSGTSLDGLDIALCKFTKTNEKWSYKLLQAKTIKYTDNIFIKELKNLYKSSAEELAFMHQKFGEKSAVEINKFLEKQKIKPEIIASHGHTIFHNPQKNYTTQIGCGATIAALTRIKTISDFRTTDIALGGQGAPLVPIADKYLFGEFDACINLGGIANISFDNENNERVAFDICAVNIVLNYLANENGLAFDKGGEMASIGAINDELLERLNNISYYKKLEAKSIGIEWIDKNIFTHIHKTEDSLYNKITTYCQHIGICFREILKNNKSIKTVLLTGGGTHNSFLMDTIAKLNPSIKITVPEKKIIDFKEAIAFAFLGTLRFYEQINTLKSATGARQDSIGGCIFL